MGHAKKGTPQGGILSPFLWLLVIDDLLMELSKAGYKVVCYADDLAILVTGKFETTLTALMQSAIFLVVNWATRNGLRVNPSKTELCLFSRKRRIPSLILPVIGDTTLALVNEVKFLGVVLNKKLHWKQHLNERASKAIRIFWTCRNAICKKWGLSPKVIRWIYTSVIRPILTHGAIIWWKALEIESNKKIYERVQRQCCIGVSGALRTTPTRALETLLFIQPIDLHVTKLAANSAIRLNLNDLFNRNCSLLPHCSILDKIREAGCQLEQECDYQTVEREFRRGFNVRIPSRREWENGNPTPADGLTVFTDGSKTEIGCGAGVSSEDLNLSLSISLAKHITVFQAEVAAINTAALTILESSIYGANIVICSDSQAALKALDKVEINSKLVKTCKSNLNTLARNNSVRLLWSPGHCMIEGNKLADKLAKEGAIRNSTPSQSIGYPVKFAKNLITEWTRKEHIRKWTNSTGCVSTKRFWGDPSEKKTRLILKFDKPSLRLYTGIVTGHILLRKHASRLGLSAESCCRGCEVEDETAEHLLCNCPAVRNRRLKHFGNHFLSGLTEAGSLKPASIIAFMREVGWVDVLQG